MNIPLPTLQRSLGNWKAVAAIASLVVVFGLLALFYFNPEVRRVYWETFHLPVPLALLTEEADAELAVWVGNYYFNVYGDGVYDLVKAEQYFKRALELDPRVPDAWHQLARIDFLRGYFNSALHKVNQQLELHGDSFMDSYYLRGLIYGYSGKFEEAEADFKTFIAWRPVSWAAHNDLAWVYFQAGEYERARQMAEEGLVLHPSNPWLLTMYGVSLLNVEEREKAHAVFERALKEAQKLTQNDWERAYPGNDPAVAGQGLAEMIEAIKKNLALTAVD